MKFTKMSLVAALLIGSSAFAIDNVKTSGNAKLYYSTTDKGADTSLFSKNGAAADAGLNLNVTADLVKNDTVAVSAGAGYTVLSTLGLENNLVSGVWGSSHGATTGTGASYPGAFGGAKVENANWMNEAWIAATAGKTTAKIGRMELDTPLVFTETWSIEKNTFEAAVVINQDIPDTTLVGAYVGNGNGTETIGQDVNGTVIGNNLAMGAVVNQDGQFTTYGKDGAYAVGAINNSFKPLTVQAWYYAVTHIATAYWLQADLDASTLGVKGLSAGLQYTSGKLTDATAAALSATTDSSSTFAGKLAYEVKDLVTVSVAYSTVGNKGAVTAANTATASGQSKLYTEAWWNYGYVTAIDTNAYNITVTSPVNGLFDLGLYYTSADHTAASNQGNQGDLQEFTATASKSFGPLDTTLAYINNKADNNKASNIIQAYLTLNF